VVTYAEPVHVFLKPSTMKMQLSFLALALTAAPFLLGSEDPPPQHVNWMKESGQLQGKIRKNEDVEASAKRLAAISVEVEAFWAKRSEVGLKSAKEASEAANAIAKAAAAGDAAGVAAASRSLGAACKACHDANREKVSEGVYKIK
jgi:cytochrome c556